MPNDSKANEGIILIISISQIVNKIMKQYQKPKSRIRQIELETMMIPVSNGGFNGTYDSKKTSQGEWNVLEGEEW